MTRNRWARRRWQILTAAAALIVTIVLGIGLVVRQDADTGAGSVVARPVRLRRARRCDRRGRGRVGSGGRRLDERRARRVSGERQPRCLRAPVHGRWRGELDVAVRHRGRRRGHGRRGGRPRCSGVRGRPVGGHGSGGRDRVLGLRAQVHGGRQGGVDAPVRRRGCERHHDRRQRRGRRHRVRVRERLGVRQPGAGRDGRAGRRLRAQVRRGRHGGLDAPDRRAGPRPGDAE